MTSQTAAFDVRAIRDRLTTKLTQELILTFSLIALTVATTSINARFVSAGNLSDMLANSAYIAIAAIGMSMVIISGNIDISVGSLIGLLATIAGKIATDGDFPLWMAYVVPVIVGALAGAVNGFLVAYLGIPAIVVTLGMMSVLKGGLILWTSGRWIYGLPSGFKLAQWEVWGFPVPALLMIFLTIVAALWMRYSNTGRAIYAVGGNAEAARLAGISKRRTLMTVFILHGVTTGIASLLFATKFNTIQSTVPAGLELFIISASVIGGVSILGGVGTVIGSTLGAVLLKAIDSAMIFANISQYWLQAVQGLLILLTVLADLLRRRRQSYLMSRE